MSDTGLQTASPFADASDAEDLALVGKLAAGDEAALAALYDRWSGRLYSVALQLVKHRIQRARADFIAVALQFLK